MRRPATDRGVHNIPAISNHRGESARHRRDRRRRGDARVLLRLSGARSLLEDHHSSNMAGEGKPTSSSPWWQCANCSWKNPGSNRCCGKCGVVKTKRSIDLPPRSGGKGGGKGGKGGGGQDGGNSGSKGGGNGRGRSSSRRSQGRADRVPCPTVSVKEQHQQQQREKKLQAQCDALQKQLSEVQRTGQPANLPAGEDDTMGASQPAGGASKSESADVAQQIKEAQAAVQQIEQLGDKARSFFGAAAIGVNLEEAKTQLADFKALSRQAKPIAERLAAVKQHIEHCERRVTNVGKQVDKAREDKLAIEAKCVDLDKKMEEAVAAAAKAKEEQLHLYEEQHEEARQATGTKLLEKPAGHTGVVGGAVPAHSAQLDAATCQLITQAVQLQCPPDTALAVLAILRALSIGELPPAAGATTAVVPVGTSNAVDAERMQPDAAIAGGKGGPTSQDIRPAPPRRPAGQDSFQPYGQPKTGAETPVPDGSNRDL